MDVSYSLSPSQTKRVVTVSDSTEALRWQQVSCLLLSVVGLAGSIYLTLVHFDSHVTLTCPENASCVKILTSNTSHFLGIPVPILGLAYFVPMTLLCLPVAWRSLDRRVHLARLVLSVIGVAMIIYLFVEELFIIKALCVWCSVVHFVGFLLFVIIALTTPSLLANKSSDRDVAEGVSVATD
jgi:uncharacterized membrane protein